MDKKLISEIEKFNKIKQYINEQEDVVEPDTALDDLEGGDDLGSDELEPLDVDTDPDVEIVDDVDNTVDDTNTEGTEELEITDLVLSLIHI